MPLVSVITCIYAIFVFRYFSFTSILVAIISFTVALSVSFGFLYTFNFEFVLSFHENVAGIEDSFSFAVIITPGTFDFARFAPTEIVHVPIGVNGEDKVPHRQGQQVNEEPEDVNGVPGSEKDQKGREA